MEDGFKSRSLFRIIFLIRSSSNAVSLIVHLSGEKLFEKRLFKASLILWSVYMVILIFTQFTKSIYYIDENNVYHRGIFYPVLLAPTIGLMTTNLIGLIRRRDSLSGKQYKAVFLYIVIPLIAMIIQMLRYGLLVIVLGMVIATSIMFISILINQTTIYEQQQDELRRKELDIMFL